ncbi:MAG: hypothetical protein N3F65_04765 [Nitrososphaeria archaeon]|nr:hypothetical protein [Nitrososphaeria archaeon]
MELIITYLSDGVEAVHQVGSNAIIMNKKVLESLLTSSKNRSERNAHIFSILLREYIRSLGVLDEVDIKKLAVKVVEEALGEDHKAYRIIPKLFQEEYKNLDGEIEQRQDKDFKYVEDFDRENAHYIA